MANEEVMKVTRADFESVGEKLEHFVSALTPAEQAVIAGIMQLAAKAPPWWNPGIRVRYKPRGGKEVVFGYMLGEQGMFNNKKTLSMLKTPLILLTLLALGIVMVLVMKMMVSMEAGTIITALLVPLLAYLLLSGAITEFGFGGVKAKFNLAASAEITLPKPGEMVPDSKDFDQVGQEGGAALEKMLRKYNLSEAKPIILSLKLGRGDYERVQTAGFIESLSSHRSFKLVVFLDRYDRVIAYMPFWAVTRLLTDEEEGERFISLINDKNDNHEQKLRKLPNVVAKPLSMRSTNAEALRQMTALNLDTLAVVDADGHLRGVVERDDVVSKMMLMLVDKSAT